MGGLEGAGAACIGLTWQYNPTYESTDAPQHVAWAIGARSQSKVRCDGNLPCSR